MNPSTMQMPRNDRPLVSILIVTWNRSHDLVRSVESALAQTYANKEIIIVDNASSDGTAELVRTRFPGVTLVLAPENLGCPSGRNFGFKHCSGRYVYMLDDDGWLKEDAVEISVRRAEATPAIAVVMSELWLTQDGQSAPRPRPAPAGTGGSYRADFSGGCSLIRREALEQVGPFPDDFFRQGEETDLALRLLEAGYYCFLEPASVMYHAMSPVGRDRRAFRFYTLRNANKTALRLWPMPWCALRPLVNLGHALRYGLSQPHFALPFLLLRSLVADLWSLPQQRRPVSRETFRLFKRLQLSPSAEVPVPGGSVPRPPMDVTRANPNPIGS